jgi:hypothetical protein
MRPNNDKILDLVNKSSETIMRVTAVELLEDAIALAKEGATPDQLMAFLRGICTTMEAARSLSMSHTGEDGRILGAAVGLGAVSIGSGRAVNTELDELHEAYQEIIENYNADVQEWEQEQTALKQTIEMLQAQLASANAPKNGHRTPPVEDEYEDDDLEDDIEEEVAPQRRRSAGSTSRDRPLGGARGNRVRGMLANRRGGRGFGRAR